MIIPPIYQCHKKMLEKHGIVVNDASMKIVLNANNNNHNVKEIKIIFLFGLFSKCRSLNVPRFLGEGRGGALKHRGR